MFDFGWSELVLILVVALVVIGPKDLPVALRTVGQWVGRARRLAREFQSSIDDVIRESELQDLRKQVDKAARTDVKDSVLKAVDPDGEIKEAFAPLEVSSPDEVTKDARPGDGPQKGQASENAGARVRRGCRPDRRRPARRAWTTCHLSIPPPNLPRTPLTPALARRSRRTGRNRQQAPETQVPVMRPTIRPIAAK